MLLVAIDCWIVRISCLSDENRLPFVVHVDGKALFYHVIKTMENRTMKECENECYDEFSCKSINWSRDNVCELNSEIQETKADDLKAKDGWIYKSTNYNTSNIGPVCQALDPCKDATFCIDICRHPGYKCITCPKYHELRYANYCQLKDFVNRFYELKDIALGKASSLSNKHGNHHASYANNGDESCTPQAISGHKQTNKWMVDLGRKAVVLNVTVKSTRAGSEHASHFTIHVGDNNANHGDQNPHCVTNVPLPYNSMKNFTCLQENEGRYVTIRQHSRHNTYFRLCYVKVYGIYL